MVIKFYCVSCREKRDGTDIQEVILANGKNARKAKCEICGKEMFRINGTEPKGNEEQLKNIKKEETNEEKMVKALDYIANYISEKRLVGSSLPGNQEIEILRSISKGIWAIEGLLRKKFGYSSYDDKWS